MGVKPPGIKDRWDDCDVIAQAELLSYDMIRSHEEIELHKNILKASGAQLS